MLPPVLVVMQLVQGVTRLKAAFLRDLVWPVRKIMVFRRQTAALIKGIAP